MVSLIGTAVCVFCASVARAATSGKAGLAWPNSVWVPMAGFTHDNTTIDWYYNWAPDPVIPRTQNPLYSIPFDFVPMLWAPNSTYLEPFLEAVANNFSGVNLTPRKDILAFNEPNQVGQADCTPQEAAQVWAEHLEPLKAQGYRLGSPAVTSAPDGMDWTQEWLRACNGSCNPDFIAVHWYDMVAEDFIQYLEYFHDTFNLPIWVTEFAMQNFDYHDNTTTAEARQATLPEIVDFMNVTLAFMERTEWVERYAWFGDMYDLQGVNPLNGLFRPEGEPRRTGALSDLGVQYAGSNGSVENTYRGGGGGGGYDGWGWNGGASTSRVGLTLFASGIALSLGLIMI